jgi:hypothetical protein
MCAREESSWWPRVFSSDRDTLCFAFFFLGLLFETTEAIVN